MRLVLGTALAVWLAANGRADVIIDVQDTIITSGASTRVDVQIRSTAVDPLDFFQYRFQISGAATNVGTLRFADPQLDDEAVDPDYVFAFGTLGPTTTAENGPAFDEVFGTDLSLFGPVAIDTTDRLFARLEVEHFLPGGVDPSLAAGDQFTISLVDADTALLADSFDPVSFVAFTGSSGVITAQAAAIPEADSGLLLVVICLAGLVIYLRRAKQQPSA